jgi:hypothetical protein
MEAEAHIRAMLEPGGELLWWGRPQLGIIINRRELRRSFWGAVALAISLLPFFLPESEDPEPPPDTLAFDVSVAVFAIIWFGLFFGGLYLLAPRYVVDANRRRHTLYALTGQRALVLNTDSQPYTIKRILRLTTINELRIETYRGSKGTLLCRSWPVPPPGSWMPFKEFNGPLFRYIDSSDHVYSLMIEHGTPRPTTKRHNPEPGDERQIRAWLLSGENLLWTGRPCPDPDEEFTGRDVLSFLLVIAYVFVAGAIVGEAFETREPRREGIGAVSDLTLTILIIGAVAFFLFGFYGGFLHHVVDAYRVNTTLYGLTNQRTIIQTWKSVRFVPLESITSFDVACDKHGWGTISCRSDVVEGLDFAHLSVDVVRKSPFDGPLFRDIPDSGNVHTLLSDARQARIAGVR